MVRASKQTDSTQAIPANTEKPATSTRQTRHAAMRAAKQRNKIEIEPVPEHIKKTVKSNELTWKGQMLRRQLKKTMICSFHAKGKCKMGAACGFAHNLSELSVLPDLAKTSVCAAWTVGECTKGSQCCQFAHGAEELRMTPLFKNIFPESPFHGSAFPTTSKKATQRGRHGAGQAARTGSKASSSHTGSIDAGMLTASSDLSVFTASSDLGERTPSIDPDEFDDDQDLQDHEHLPQPLQTAPQRHYLPPTQLCRDQPQQRPQDCVQPCIIILSNVYIRIDTNQLWIHRMTQYLMTAPKRERDALAEVLMQAAPKCYED